MRNTVGGRREIHLILFLGVISQELLKDLKVIGAVRLKFVTVTRSPHRKGLNNNVQKR